jgi:site-specific DNA-methyltransferase (adenine-specific)
MKIQTLQIKDLTPDPNNARQHDDKNLKAIQGSLKEFGQRKPIVITEDGVIVAGNGTVEAAKRLGWLEIQAVTVPGEWTPNQIKAFALADNRTAELATWNMEVLDEQLWELEQEELDVTVLGFESRVVAEVEDPFTLLKDEPRKDATQMTFTVTLEQAEVIKEKLRRAKQSPRLIKDENENSNGNALYLISSEWEDEC